MEEEYAESTVAGDPDIFPYGCACLGVLTHHPCPACSVLTCVLSTLPDDDKVVPEVLASVDAVEALEAALAAGSPDEPKLAQAAPWNGLLSPAVQGMILLNVSAALFGSNQVHAAGPLPSGRTTEQCTKPLLILSVCRANREIISSI